MKSLIITIKIFIENIKSIYQTFRRQKIGLSSYFVIFLLLLALIFMFLAAAPALSPFIYPLF